MTLIQRPDLVSRLRQFLGIRELHVVPTLADKVRAVVILGDVRDELRQQKPERPAAGFVVVPAVVAQCGEAWIRNPVDSGVLVNLHRIQVNLTSMTFTLAGMLVDLPTLGSTVFRDNPSMDTIPPSGGTFPVDVPKAIISADNTSLVLPVGFHYRADTPLHDGRVSSGWTLFPGMGLRIKPTTFNTAVAVSFLWTESDLEA